MNGRLLGDSGGDRLQAPCEMKSKPKTMVILGSACEELARAARPRRRASLGMRISLTGETLAASRASRTAATRSGRKASPAGGISRMAPASADRAWHCGRCASPARRAAGGVGERLGRHEHDRRRRRRPSTSTPASGRPMMTTGIFAARAVLRRRGPARGSPGSSGSTIRAWVFRARASRTICGLRLALLLGGRLGVGGGHRLDVVIRQDAEPGVVDARLRPRRRPSRSSPRRVLATAGPDDLDAPDDSPGDVGLGRRLGGSTGWLRVPAEVSGHWPAAAARNRRRRTARPPPAWPPPAGPIRIPAIRNRPIMKSSNLRHEGQGRAARESDKMRPMSVRCPDLARSQSHFIALHRFNRSIVRPTVR